MTIEAGRRPKKRLALFLDGTWNVVSDNTNVWRLRALFAPTGRDNLEQRAFYSTGLGTKFGERIRGGMFGRGIDTAITSAYEWLIDNYELNDEIFIFGFSRGAYTARSLSGFISLCGLLKRGAPLGVNQLFTRYRRGNVRNIRQLVEDEAKGTPPADVEERWMLKYSLAVPIEFIGVFDTVGALGVPFPRIRKLSGSSYEFLNTGLRQNNHLAFHAIAVDEHRVAFAPTLWTNMGATNAKARPIDKTEQRWFTGAHANVGGGCTSDPLSQLPLQWIESKAAAAGLGFLGNYAPEPDAVLGRISDSYGEFLRGAYKVMKLGRRYYRPINVPPLNEGTGVKIINETIDASVFARWRRDSSYRPPALTGWAARTGVDPDAINASVRADNPGVSVPD